MRFGILQCMYLFLVLFPQIARSQLDRASRDEQALEHFQSYLDACPTNAIHCIWFLDGRATVGMEMTIDLRSNNVYTVRHVYNWAYQNSETRRLSYPQWSSLKKICDELPSSDSGVEFTNAISVSVRREGKVEVYHYDPKHFPATIQRIYDLGGGALPDVNARRP